MFDSNRFEERVAVTIRNIRNIGNTNCINNDLSKLSDDAIRMIISPVLMAYDEELGAMFQQYSEAMNKIGPSNG